MPSAFSVRVPGACFLLSSGTTCVLFGIASAVTPCFVSVLLTSLASTLAETGSDLSSRA